MVNPGIARRSGVPLAKLRGALLGLAGCLQRHASNRRQVAVSTARTCLHVARKGESAIQSYVCEGALRAGRQGAVTVRNVAAGGPTHLSVSHVVMLHPG